jgi:hypothetical protein
MGATDMCIECVHPRFKHIRHVEKGLPEACAEQGCTCWAFTEQPPHEKRRVG